MTKYNFSTRAYIGAHGRAPRGKGYWGFILKNKHVKGLPDAFVHGSDTTFWVPGCWTLTEAKKRARIVLEANAVDFDATVEVAP